MEDQNIEPETHVDEADVGEDNEEVLEYFSDYDYKQEEEPTDNQDDSTFFKLSEGFELGLDIASNE